MIFTLIILQVNAYSQLCDTSIYYSTKLGIVNNTNANKVETLKKINQNNYILLSYNYVNNNKTELRDSTFIILNNDSSLSMITFKTNGSIDSIIRNYKKTDSTFRIQDFKHGRMFREGFSNLITPLIKQGKWTFYSFNTGKRILESIYKNDIVVNNRSWDENGVEKISDVYGVVDIQPVYKNGQEQMVKYLRKSFKNSPLLSNNNSKVYVKIIIMGNGTIGTVEILKGINTACDEEIKKIVQSMPGTWSPAILNGKNVRSSLMLPISFQ